MLAQARAQAAVAKGSALALLASEYGTRLALLQQTGGPDLAAKIDALMREQREAERALLARLDAEDKAQRKALRGALKAPTTPAEAYRGAAREVARRAGDDGPQRPEDLRRIAMGQPARR